MDAQVHNANSAENIGTKWTNLYHELLTVGYKVTFWICTDIKVDFVSSSCFYIRGDNCIACATYKVTYKVKWADTDWFTLANQITALLDDSHDKNMFLRRRTVCHKMLKRNIKVKCWTLMSPNLVPEKNHWHWTKYVTSTDNCLPLDRSTVLVQLVPKVRNSNYKPRQN